MRYPECGKFPNHYLLSLWLLLIYLLTGCGGGGGGDSGKTNMPPEDSGLTARPTNLTCTAFDEPVPNYLVELQQVFVDLQFDSPIVALLQAPGDSSRWFAAGRTGQVWVFANDPQISSASVFLDIRKRIGNALGFELGLKGIAFHPNFANNGQVFISYSYSKTDPITSPYVNRLSRFISSDGGQTLDPASEKILVTFTTPENYHNIDGIAFGPDGYLYIGIGDGGPQADPNNTGQRTDELLGSILRIDVDKVDSARNLLYAIPPDNPFINGGGRPEIYAYGFRNPWRFSFDHVTGELWVGDVGNSTWEEVDRVEKGGNYGWSIREGSHCVKEQDCNKPGLIDPIVEYPHDGQAKSVTGGYVYRGGEMVDLQGMYIYGDFITGMIWGLKYDAGAPQVKVLTESSFDLVAFAEDMDKELYAINFNGGFYKLVSRSSNPPEESNFPTKLTQTGCVDPQNPTEPASGLIPYDVNQSFWSDGAAKERLLALPDNSTIRIDEGSGHWDLPVGSVIMKNFRIGNQLIETRLLVRHNSGQWAGYSYEWDDAQTEAIYVPGGKVRDIQGQEWIYPSSAQCLECHTVASGFTLGLETAQMNGDYTYPTTGRTANQLVTYNFIELFNPPLNQTPEQLPAFPDIHDETVPLETRARSYLHVNCAQCHRPGGPTAAQMDLRYQTAERDMNVCDKPPVRDDLGIADARLLAPGDPDRSVLLQRLKRRDVKQMPPLGSNLVDEEGARLIEQWIQAKQSCQQ